MPSKSSRSDPHLREPQVSSSGRVNTAAARQLVSCRWIFTDSYIPQIPGLKRGIPKVRQWLSMDDPSSRIVENILLPEDGWYVHHYFEKYVVISTISVNFYNSHAEPINLGSSDNWSTLMVKPEQSRRGKENWQRSWLELTQLAAALLVPLATLASTTVSGCTSGHWWEVVAIGFGSDTVKNILVGNDESQSSPQRAATK